MGAAMRYLVASAFFLLLPLSALAHNPETPETTSPEGTTFLEHPDDVPYWFGAEVNSIGQAHPAFHAAYSGSNSLRNVGEGSVSALFDLFFAYQPFRTTELILDGEVAAGGGLSQALGLAGISNLDAVRNPSLGSEPYVSRAMWHQIIPLSKRWIENEDRGPNSSLPSVPEERLELRVGKFSTVDFFDINPAGSDSHMQFMNWAVDNNAAYDYAADTRGYTLGAMVEYQSQLLEVRFAEMLMPTVANGINYDYNFGDARGENVEVEVHYLRRRNWNGTLRMLSYINHANMGSYHDAIQAFRGGQDTAPDITRHRIVGNIKFGFGGNLVQELGPHVRGFVRGGWNDGASESFAYTECDDTFEVGADVRGTLWHRTNDRVGLAFVSNGLSADHRTYLAIGGHGFLLGDGRLRYNRETITEAYYNVQAWRGLFFAFDIQAIANPGYNADRGPVAIFSLRAHAEF